MDYSSRASVIREARILSITHSILDYVLDSTFSPDWRRRFILFTLLLDGPLKIRSPPGIGISAILAMMGPLLHVPDALIACTVGTRILPLAFMPIVGFIRLEATDREAAQDVLEGFLAVSLYSFTALALRYGTFFCAVSVGLMAKWAAILVVPFLALSLIAWRVHPSGIKRHFGHVASRFSHAVTCLTIFVINWVMDPTAASVRICMRLYNQWETRVVHKMNRHIVSSVSPRYQYGCLSNPREIRILKLRRRWPLSKLQCDLFHVSLDQVEQFEAISYTWRGEAPTEQILVNGSCLNVTPAIYEMLRYRHSFLGSKNFWIDGVCINQNDLDERSQQVLMMRDIYHFASRVVVWLGPQNEALNAQLVPETLRFLEDIHDSPEKEITDSLLGNRQAGWGAILHLLNHSWFERVWVVQEVAVAETVHVMYGDVCINWDHLSNSLEPVLSRADLQKLMLTSGDGTIEHFLNANTISHFQKTLKLGIFMSLGDIMIRVLTFKSTDPRDKIFAIFGMTAADESHGLVPDYQKSTPEVYQAATSYLISTGNAWHISYALQLGGIGFLSSSAVPRDNSPSWVADFTERLVSRVVWNGKGRDLYGHEKTGWDVQELFSSSPDALLLDAVEIDRLKYLAESYWVDDESRSSSDIVEYSRRWLVQARALLDYTIEKSALVASDVVTLEEEFYRVLLKNETHDDHTQLITYKDRFGRLLKAMENISEFGENETEEVSNLFQITNRCIGRRLCSTTRHRFVLVPPLCEKDDIICTVRGLRPPFLLRQAQVQESGSSLSIFKLVGSCYIQDMMEMQIDNLPWRPYRLQ